jgi:hypothetical protein
MQFIRRKRVPALFYAAQKRACRLANGKKHRGQNAKERKRLSRRKKRKRKHGKRTEKPELLTHDGKDEIVLRLGDVHVL